MSLAPTARTSAEDIQSKKGTKGVVFGAAAVGGVIGLITSGPILGVGFAVAAGGMAAAAEDKRGDLARSGGRLACTTYQRAVELNEKHDITGRAASSAKAAAAKAGELDERYEIRKNVKHSFKSAVRSIKEADKKHGISDKVCSGMAKGMDSLTDAIGGNRHKDQGAGNDDSKVPPSQYT